MMKRPIVSFVGRVGALLALCALPGHDAYGRHLQPDEALSMVRTGAMRSASAAQLRLAYTQKSAASESTVYVFNRDNAPGFYVLAADDAVGDIVLGYSPNGHFSAENMAPGMKWLLGVYSAQVSSCAASAAPVTAKAAPAGLQAVTPLLPTKWDQGEPYNDMCPVYDGERAVTGCVATAMAQVMKKHKWPASGTGSYSYTSNGVRVSSNFSSHVYDWDNMLDEYTDEYYQPVGTQAQREAVAQLMLDCGVAAQMIYSPYGSSATSVNAAKGMLNYFSYDKSMQYLKRGWYTDDDWMRLMHSQISQGLPVIYGGDSDEGYGHEFVLDGYDGEGYFHFNWGWGGWDDGYYSLAFNAPEDKDITYVNAQEALVNIRPDMGSSYIPLMALGGALLTNATQYEAQSGYITFTTTGQYGGFYSRALSEIAYELGVRNTLNGEVVSLGSYSIPVNYGFVSISADSRSFPVGDYDVYMVYKGNDSDWTPMLYDVNITSGKLHFTNDGTTITVSEPSTDVPATGITLSAVEQQLTEGDTFTLKATVSPENATDKTVKWHTSDAAVATVDAEGKVTAIAPGTATITATCGSVSASCTVTVVADIKKVNQAAYEIVIKEIEALKAEFESTVAQLKEENPDYDFSEWNEIIGGALEMAETGAAQALAAANEDGELFAFAFAGEEISDMIKAMIDDVKRSALVAANQAAYEVVIREIEALKADFESTVAQLKEENPGYDFSEWNEIIGGALEMAETGAAQALAVANEEGEAFAFAFDGEEIQNMIKAMVEDVKASALVAANQAAYENVIKEIEALKAEFEGTVVQLKEENPDYNFSEWEEIIGGALEMAETGAAQALAAANEDGEAFAFAFDGEEIQNMIKAMVEDVKASALVAANQAAYEVVIKEIEALKAEFEGTVAQLKEDNPDYDFSEWEEIIGGALEMAETGAAQALAAANEDGEAFAFAFDGEEIQLMIDAMIDDVKTSGIETIENMVSEGKAMIYTLDGRKVANPARGGVNIIVTPTSTKKVYIRK